jgi:glycine dehydrogenase
MIPLGSCTMKLNAASEMLPVTWPSSAPAPVRAGPSRPGATAAVRELEAAAVRGSPASPPCPAAQRGQPGRVRRPAGHPRLSPRRPRRGRQARCGASSRVGPRHQPGQRGHGRHERWWSSSATITATSTWPTCGPRPSSTPRRWRADGHLPVHARRVRGDHPEICAIVHEHGGQVYMDGANMNAQVGLTAPADRRGRVPPEPAQDLLHPARRRRAGHGARSGAAHLAPFLPGHPVVAGGGSKAIGPCRPRRGAAPASCPSRTDVHRDAGGAGLTDARRYAILNANYIKARLEGHYDVALHRGRTDGGARDDLRLRPFKEKGVDERTSPSG